MISQNNFRRILYFLSVILIIPQIIMLIIRLFRGKERLERVFERISIASDEKIDDLVWIHAASVGETVIAFSLIDIIRKKFRKQKFLLTTGTITSADLAESKMESYNHVSEVKVVTHQMLPTDNIFLAPKFLDYWNPKLGIFIESELWPNILFSASKKCPIILVNARMSPRSFKRWGYLKSFIGSIAGLFSDVFVQSEIDLKHYQSLGFKNSKLVGNIKYAQKDEIINQDLFYNLQSQLDDKKIIFAASTHDPEEKMILEVYKKLKTKNQDLFLVIAPRHPSRIDEIKDFMKDYKLKLVTRSSGKKIDNRVDVYILDSIGEMSAIFKLKPITFMGGSFTIGGHNILEPARYANPIIFGSDMSNFQEIADEFLNNKAAIQVRNIEELETKIDFLINLNKKDINAITKSASEIINSKQNIEKEYLKEISKYL
jgi:3-deoxy-D-manno-octulosonic-acid transferase